MYTKIFVTQLPRVAPECPFCSYDDHHTMEHKCMLMNNEYTCKLDYGSHCVFLKELPKGYKDNGSSEDK